MKKYFLVLFHLMILVETSSAVNSGFKISTRDREKVKTYLNRESKCRFSYYFYKGKKALPYATCFIDRQAGGGINSIEVCEAMKVDLDTGALEKWNEGMSGVPGFPAQWVGLTTKGKCSKETIEKLFNLKIKIIPEVLGSIAFMKKESQFDYEIVKDDFGNTNDLAKELNGIDKVIEEVNAKSKKEAEREKQNALKVEQTQRLAAIETTKKKDAEKLSAGQKKCDTLVSEDERNCCWSVWNSQLKPASSEDESDGNNQATREAKDPGLECCISCDHMSSTDDRKSCFGSCASVKKDLASEIEPAPKSENEKQEKLNSCFATCDLKTLSLRANCYQTCNKKYRWAR